QSFAVRHPHALRRLVLLATAPGDGHGVPPLPDAIKGLTGGDLTALFGLLFPSYQTAARDAYIAHITKRKGFVGTAPVAVTARQNSASIAWLLGQDRDGKRVGKLKAHALVAGGEDDHLLPIGNDRHLAALIPHATLVTYPAAAH